MKTLVKNGMIVSPEDTYEADVLIEDGVIECKKTWKQNLGMQIR